MPRRTPTFQVNILALSVAMLAGSASWAQGDDESRVTNQALTRQREATSVRSAAAEGQTLLERDVVKLDGYAYCGQAVSLAEQGEFRQSIRASSKALFLGERDKKPDLQALAHRDLAMAYLYAGKIDEADQYARSALQFPGASPEQVLAPAHKLLGDVAARRGNPAGAISEYNEALKTASERYRPQIIVSLANALNAAGQPKQALQQLDASRLDHRVERKRRSRFALAPAAMAAIHEQRCAGHAITHRAARAASFE